MMETIARFFLADATAQQGAGQGSGLMGLIFPVLLIVIFYFLLIRPQTKRAKEHKALIEALKKGDEVVTNGGLLGRIAEVGDNFILLDAAEGVQLKVQRQSVAGVMPKGTTKSL
jgi:preprotein translocase subunit YajC